MEITPQKIRKIYENTSPYQVDDIIKHYLGQKICWDLTYYSVTKLDKGLVHVALHSDSVLVVCNINENDFPLIKIISKDTPIRLVGIISRIDGISIEVKDACLHEIRNDNGQIYFPQGSREELLAFLTSKVLGARDIKIYDSYPSNDILELLESTSSEAEIRLLGQNIDVIFSEQIRAFNTYFKKNMIAKKINVSHARFYIIDGEVLQVDSSLKNLGGNKATTVNMIEKEAAEAIKKDFDKWWNDAVEV